MKNNLQTVASLLRLQARDESVEPRKALEDSVNRVLAIAAVHEVLTEQRDEEIDLAELLDRLRAMLTPEGRFRAPGDCAELRAHPARRATVRPRSRSVFSELLGNAPRAPGGDGGARAALQRVNGELVLAIVDDGPGIAAQPGRRQRHRALHRSKRARPRRAAGHTRARRRRRGTRAEVRSPRLDDGEAGPQTRQMMRILLAEDETIIRLDLRELLERAPATRSPPRRATARRRSRSRASTQP